MVNATILNPSYTVRRGNPKRAFSIFEQRLDAAADQSLFGCERGESATFEKPQTGSGSDPEIAFAIFKDGLDSIAGQPFIRREQSELPIRACEPGPQPYRSTAHPDDLPTEREYSCS